MAMLSSYTTTLAPAPGKSSPAAALQLLRSRQPPPPAAAAAAVALRWAASCKESRSRAALLACRANKDKYMYDIEPSALVQTPTLAGDDWSIMGDKDIYILKLRVGEATSQEKLHIETKKTEDQVRLVIRYTGNADDASPATSTSLNVDLKMPPGYHAHKQAHASKFDEWLIVVIAKPKHTPNKTTVQSALMKYWRVLYPDMDKEAMEEGVNTILKIAMRILGASRSKGGDHQHDDED